MCILLVEDEFLIRIAAQIALEEGGFEVLDAEHGEAAIAHLDRFPRRFTALVTDFHLSGPTTGAHVIDQMRPTYPGIPMVLASALPRTTSIAWRQERNVFTLVKPYDPVDLVTLVRRLLP